MPTPTSTRARATRPSLIAPRPSNIDHTLALAYDNRAAAYVNKDENDKAIADCTEAIRLNPKDALAYGNRATARLRKGDDDKAIADCTEAIRLNRKDASVYSNRGRYLNKGENDKAIADCTEAIRFDPTYALAYGNRAAAYLNKGENDKAIADCTEAIEHDPKCAFAYLVAALPTNRKAIWTAPRRIAPERLRLTRPSESSEPAWRSWRCAARTINRAAP